MKKEELANGMIRLSAPNGIKDIRNGWKGKEAIVKPADEKYFIANEER